MNEPSSTTPAAPRRRGLAIHGYASRAAKKGHEMGPPYCHQWTRSQAIEASRKEVQARRERLQAAALLYPVET
jgi:hypothetical protein